jgi:hypothetical protein
MGRSSTHCSRTNAVAFVTELCVDQEVAMLTVAEVRVMDLAENQDAIAVFSFAIIGLLASLLFATAFSWPADMAEALPPVVLTSHLRVC